MFGSLQGCGFARWLLKVVMGNQGYYRECDRRDRHIIEAQCHEKEVKTGKAETQRKTFGGKPLRKRGDLCFGGTQGNRWNARGW